MAWPVEQCVPLCAICHNPAGGEQMPFSGIMLPCHKTCYEWLLHEIKVAEDINQLAKETQSIKETINGA